MGLSRGGERGISSSRGETTGEGDAGSCRDGGVGGSAIASALGMVPEGSTGVGVGWLGESSSISMDLARPARWVWGYFW